MNAGGKPADPPDHYGDALQHFAALGIVGPRQEMAAGIRAASIEEAEQGAARCPEDPPQAPGDE